MALGLEGDITSLTTCSWERALVFRAIGHVYNLVLRGIRAMRLGHGALITLYHRVHSSKKTDFDGIISSIGRWGQEIRMRRLTAKV